MWRYDAARSATSPHALADQLHLQWVRQLPKPAPAWPEEQYKLQFDRSYEPVVLGRQIFVPSMVSDSVAAYDTATGRQAWRFYCDGPVRFAPVGWKDRLYFVSDDGFLYCVNASDGKLIRKVQLAPSDRRILGNGRLISTWPARGGPVIHNGTLYCTAGIWPFMGIFIYAIDAETGDIVWENSGSGARYMTQQHNSPAFGGVAPQGYLAATEDKLLIPGRTTPACYDAQTGKLLYYRLSDRAMGKYVGGYRVYIRDGLFFNNDVVHRLKDGRGLVRSSVQTVSQDAVVAFDAQHNLVGYVPQLAKDAASTDGQAPLKAKGLWNSELGLAIEKVHMQAGDRLYAGNSQGKIAAIDIPAGDGVARVAWSYRVKGAPWSMIAGDGKLFVVTTGGLLYCFGPQNTAPQWHNHHEVREIKAPRAIRRKARRIIRRAGTREGHCLMLGIEDGDVLRALLRESEFHIVAVDPDVGLVERLREEMDGAGLYGRRLSILTGDLTSLDLPPYMADLIVAANIDNSTPELLNCLRPYGGIAWLGGDSANHANLSKRIADCAPLGSRITKLRNGLLVRRNGPLPGAADWTGMYGDPANTVCSEDELEGPLGLLWFGDNSSFTDVLPRHGHGPSEQVVAGRLFIEGINSISARDVYTGRILWKAEIKNPLTYGVYYDATYNSDYHDKSYNQVHIPGANSRGANFVASADKVYVIDGAKCRVLSAVDGGELAVFSLPPCDGEQTRSWAYIGLCADVLLAGADFADYLKFPGDRSDEQKWAEFFNKHASRRLVAMDRHTGEVLWSMQAEAGFIHNAIAAGNGRVFCIDGLPPYIRRQVIAREAAAYPAESLVAIDMKSGEILWRNQKDVFGSWLGYSEKHDVLLQAYRRSRDMIWEPGDRMAVHEGASGDILWDKRIEYNGPCMLCDDRIITQAKAYHLLTGAQVMRSHPLTGESVPWEYSRNYGCNTAVASRNLLTFRSAAAGYFDLAGDGGTGNFGGFKSGCTNNLIIANGVLNAPEYTRTCTCSYQNQTSLALVHDPDAETWTFNTIEVASGVIRRLGINFGAPGDRKGENGTLWLDYPSVGGPSPAVKIDVDPQRPTWFRRHASRLRGGSLKWVEASGARGLRRIVISLTNEENSESAQDDPKILYTVRLHFAEPDLMSEGERIFDVSLQGKEVLKDFDIVAAAGDCRTGIVKQFTDIAAHTRLSVELTPKAADVETVLCGIELFQQTDPAPSVPVAKQ